MDVQLTNTDNVALVAGSVRELQGLVDRVKTASEKVGVMPHAGENQGDGNI